VRSLKQRLTLWLARVALAASIAVTLALSYAWWRSNAEPEEFIRTRWAMSSTTDDIWRTRIHVIGGSAAVFHEHRAEPAFTGAFVVDLPFATNRTEPAGVMWERSPSPQAYLDAMIRSAGSSDGPRWLERLGIGWIAPRTMNSPFGNASEWWVQVALVPLIAMAGLITLLLTFAWWRAGRGKRRFRAGLCAACGYDLRETPARCPECGTIARPAAAAAAVTAGQR
jgi:hypothetical protein